MIVYISIGNSDDKLSQAEWSTFVQDTADIVSDNAVSILGVWFSSPASQWQNACWSADIHSKDLDFTKGALAELAKRYRQDSIAWAPVARTEFLGEVSR
jgi:hypothetical protein